MHAALQVEFAAPVGRCWIDGALPRLILPQRIGEVTTACEPLDFETLMGKGELVDLVAKLTW